MQVIFKSPRDVLMISSSNSCAATKNTKPRSIRTTKIVNLDMFKASLKKVPKRKY